MEIAILFLLVFGLLFAGAPVAISLGLSSVLFIAFFSRDSMSSVALQLFTASQNYTLLAIPFFVLAGDLMTAGGISRRLVGFADVLVRQHKGGLGMVAVLAAAFFAALSGSAPATTAAIGSIMIPEMEKRGYSRPFATALAVAGASLPAGYDIDGKDLTPLLRAAAVAATASVDDGRGATR